MSASATGSSEVGSGVFSRDVRNDFENCGARRSDSGASCAGMISSTIEIGRRPDEVFAYVAELDRLSEWQDAIVSVRKEPAGPTRVGTRAIELRRTPVGAREIVSEIVEYDPPRRLV